MKSNAEIRREARKILSNGWFGRIACVGIVLYSIALVVQLSISGAFASMNVQTMYDFAMAKVRAAQGGLSYTLPSAEAFWSLMGTYAFQQLAGYLFGAIFLFGLATVLLKSVKSDAERWFSDSFGGFTRPLEVLWLIVLMNIRIFLWGLLLVVPGIVAMYRYRQAWYLKSENPDWGAAKCLAESGRIMKGFKWAAFCLDVYFIVMSVLYCLAILIVLIGTGVVFHVATSFLTVGSSLASAFVSALATLSTTWFLIYYCVYYFMARTVFYKAICDKAECPAES